MMIREAGQKLVLVTRSLLFFCICILCLAHAFAVALVDLQFRQNTFKIALFADLHYGEAASEEWGPAQDRNSTRVMSDILDLERPDLVVFLGDILTANNMASPNATKYWNEALSATWERGIPWTSVFGNHDDMPFEWPIEWFGSDGIPGENQITEYFRGTTRAELFANEMTYELSQSRHGPKSLWPSLSNYVLPIRLPSNLNSSSAPAVLLYFLDSGGGSYPEVISAPQAAWFHETSTVLNPDRRITELAFWHIPTYAYTKVASTPGSSILPPCAGSINEEQVDPQIKEFGFMDILSARQSVKASFVGHNHGLDWCCPHRGMHLCFARHTGYGGYGTWTRGARILELELSYLEEYEEEEKPRRQFARSDNYINSALSGQAAGAGRAGISVRISTYIRLEDGSITGWLDLK